MLTISVSAIEAGAASSDSSLPSNAADQSISATESSAGGGEQEPGCCQYGTLGSIGGHIVSSTRPLGESVRACFLPTSLVPQSSAEVVGSSTRSAAPPTS